MTVGPHVHPQHYFWGPVSYSWKCASKVRYLFPNFARKHSKFTTPGKVIYQRNFSVSISLLTEYMLNTVFQVLKSLDQSIIHYLTTNDLSQPLMVAIS